MEKIIVERGRPQMTVWRMRIAGWVPKATNTHSEQTDMSKSIVAFRSLANVPRSI